MEIHLDSVSTMIAKTNFEPKVVQKITYTFLMQRQMRFHQHELDSSVDKVSFRKLSPAHRWAAFWSLSIQTNNIQTEPKLDSECNTKLFEFI